jgi:hypothetical protein
MDCQETRREGNPAGFFLFSEHGNQATEILPEAVVSCMIIRNMNPGSGRTLF